MASIIADSSVLQSNIPLWWIREVKRLNNQAAFYTALSIWHYMTACNTSELRLKKQALAAVFGISESTVKRGLKVLKESGLIKTNEQVGKASFISILNQEKQPLFFPRIYNK